MVKEIVLRGKLERISSIFFPRRNGCKNQKIIVKLSTSKLWHFPWIFFFFFFFFAEVYVLVIFILIRRTNLCTLSFWRFFFRVSEKCNFNALHHPRSGCLKMTDFFSLSSDHVLGFSRRELKLASRVHDAEDENRRLKHQLSVSQNQVIIMKNHSHPILKLDFSFSADIVDVWETKG